MPEPNAPNSNPDLSNIIAAATSGRVEVDTHATTQWLVAMSQADRTTEIAHRTESGIFGHRIALLDFDADDLAYFRRLARHVRTVAHPQVESAIAISGSSAQGQVQLFPGDCDFFERVNIHAPDLESAKRILREVLRATALRAFSEPDIVLIEANLGAYPVPVLERGQPRAAGDAITWMPQDVLNGYIEVVEAGRDVSTKRLASETLRRNVSTGTNHERIFWDDVDAGKGWTYLGWIVADRERGRIALASNMLDVTWQAPDGTITSLDGAIDPFFQEIYLEPTELPIFTKLAQQITPEARDSYKQMMRAQVAHYTYEEPNFGKASKRLYNLFRLTDQLEAAAYVRELFDEPIASLYQVPGLLEAADIALHDPRAEIDRATVLQQIDLVTEQVKRATDGHDEARIVGELERLRVNVLSEPPGADWDAILGEVRKQCAEIVNEFFRARLYEYAAIKEFIENLQK